MTAPAEAVSTQYQAPARALNLDGATRKVGLELEFASLSLDATLEIIGETLGGRIVVESRTEGRVEDTPFGKFKVELDSKSLKERRYLEPLQRLGLESESATAQRIEDSVLDVAKEFVPIEIVSPPIAWNQLGQLDPLWARLREAGAADTKSPLFYAFGLHLNPESPDFEARTILSYLQSFVLLEDWTSNLRTPILPAASHLIFETSQKLTDVSAYLSTFDLPLRLQRCGWVDTVRDRVVESLPEPSLQALA